MNSPHEYYKTAEKQITDFTETNIDSLYNEGYKFTRLSYGNMQQTRSLRVDLAKFNLNSENRRVLRKFPNLSIEINRLPIELKDYDWKIAKLAKDFYDIKFGNNTFSTNKIKEILTQNSNFNTILIVKNKEQEAETKVLGYVICYKSSNILHYSYPFYDLTYEKTSLGICIMTKTIEYCKNIGLKYVYLGGVTKPLDSYKLQFEGLEYFDNGWKTDIQQLKDIISK